MTTEAGWSDTPVEILLVDDSPTQAAQLWHQLEVLGRRVVVAGNGTAALEMMADRIPSAIVADVVMPGMDGYELCRRVRQSPATSDIPVILLTSLSAAEDVLEGLAAGADAFLNKPCSPDHLLATLDRIVASNQLRVGDRAVTTLEIAAGGQDRVILADPQRVLSLLVSAYEVAVAKNADLAEAQNERTLLNQRLESLVVERTARLDDRLRQLDCLVAVSRLVADLDRSLDEVLEAVVGLVPYAWPPADATQARILFEGREFGSSDVGLCPHPLSVEIVVHGDVAGSMEVCRQEAGGGFGDQRFTREEEELVGAIVSQIGAMVERRRAEGSLRESRALLRSVVDSTTDAIYTKDLDGRYTLFNTGAEAITGRSAEEVLGRDDTFLFPPDEAVVVIAGDRGAMARSRPTTYEERVTDATGQLRTYLSTKGPLRDDDGSTVGLFGIARDITERRAAEEELRETRDRLELAQSASGAGIWDWDVISGGIKWSREMFVLFGLDEATVEAGFEAWNAAMHPDDIEVANARVARALAEHTALDNEYRVVTPGGEVRWINALGHGVYDERGEPVRMLGMCVDITERRTMAEELRETRDYLENLFRYANAPIIVWDSELRITRFNHAFEELTGRTAEEVVGERLELLFPDDERRAQTLELVTTASAGERWQVVEIPILGQGGEVRTVLWNSATLYAEGGTTPVATIAQGQDITQRKAALAEILRLNESLEVRVQERTAELQAAVNELQAFNYSASHDLRAPLRSIAGFAAMLERRIGADLDKESRHYLDTIRVSGERMGVLIEELLDYSRLGQGSVISQPVPLVPILERIRSLFADRIGAASATVEAMVPISVPLGDPNLLERILVNLVDNALAYRRPDVPPRILLSATRTGGNVVVSLADNGIGIEPEYRERVFELFTRLHPEGEYPGGTGIGLSIARKAARLMGSEVSLTSVEGEGSIFSLVLPAAGEEESAP